MAANVGRPKVDVERREQILSAFEACVIEYGLAKTTLQKVADKAGLPRSLVRYFVGNRAEMVQLLLNRMNEKADRSIAEQFPENPTLSELLDLIFDGAFNDHTSNLIVDQLWELSRRDAAVKQQLQQLYSGLKQRITAQMRAEGLPSPSRHGDVAQCLIALGYGEACFEDLGMKTKRRNTSRVCADVLLAQLGEVKE
jgi:AcrR family transcriptional regulator